IDVTDPVHPGIVESALVPIPDARDIYITRTYAYVAAGADGLAIVDVEKPESPVGVANTTEGNTTDATALKVGMTNSCLYAYVADGRNGLKVFQLTSPDPADGTPTYMGFSPLPKPRLIATFKTNGPAIA